LLPKVRLELQRRQNQFNESYRDLQGSLKARGADVVPKTFQVIQEFEGVVGDLYRMRVHFGPEDSLRLRSEDFIATISQDLLGLRKAEKSKTRYRDFLERYRRAWRENFSLFLFTLFLFVGCFLLAWYAVKMNPLNAGAFIPESLMDDIVDNYRWFDRVQNSPWLFGLLIAFNNIKVGLFCFMAGAVLGFGGLILLGYNGLHFGAVFAFAYYKGFTGALTTFVLGHGILEMTILIAATFAGLIVGRTFYQRPFKYFGKRMAYASQEAKTILAGVLPWLLLAAAVEVFVSPWPYFSVGMRLLISLTITASFWLWTFWPPSKPHRLPEQ